MSGPSGEKCADCYFSERWAGEGNEEIEEPTDPLYCHRYPPAKDRSDEDVGFFPITVAEEDWCGEFKRKPAP